MKTIRLIILTAAMLFGLISFSTAVQAQTTETDSVVSVEADIAELSLLPTSDVPSVGTFWLVTGSNGVTAPFPCAPPGIASDNTYAMPNGSFLVDGTAGESGVSDGQLAAQMNAVSNLIVMAQAQAIATTSRTMGVRAMDDSGPPIPGGGSGGGDYTNAIIFSSYSFDTNQLWLEITNVSNGIAYLNAHNATNMVYGIYAASDLTLPFTNWMPVAELWPTNGTTNVLPFSVSANVSSNLFLRAMDWTDAQSNGLPLWWMYYWFGDLNESATNFDSSEYETLLIDYQYNREPYNDISFNLAVTNNYVNIINPTVNMNVTAGYPHYVAISVDDTNYVNDADWQPYTGDSLNVNLGFVEGWHDVWVGLRGFATNDVAMWQWVRLKLDLTPPQIVITNPIIGTVDVPRIQLQGFSSKALSSISYDLTNANGLVTNQQILVTDQDYNTNTWEFAANTFQGFDIPLTNGLNEFTIHATDLAGNVTITNFSFMLDYSNKTNPPNVQVAWPQDGMEICGSNIVCRGSVSDPTATVMVQLVDANGQTNTVGSLVGRDGMFYANNLTLATGTNVLSFTATDVVGNTITTNISVSTSSLGLTLNPVAAGQTLVTGTISDTNYVVYVNGLLATNNGDGTWSVQIASIGVGGGTVVVNAVQNDGDPTLQQMVSSPEGIYVSSYQDNEIKDILMPECIYPPWNGHFVLNGFNYWANGGGGNSQSMFPCPNPGQATYFWPASSFPQPLPNGNGFVSYAYGPTDTIYSYYPPYLPMEHCQQKINGAPNQLAAPDELLIYSQRTADTEVKLATGGPAGSTAENLWLLTAGATDQTTGQPIPPQQISVGSFGNLDTNGELYTMLPDGDPVITERVSGKSYYTFSVGAMEFHPEISLNGTAVDPDTVYATNCVGQQLTFSVGWFPYTPDNIADESIIWELPGTYVNTNSDPNCDLYYSADNSQLHRSLSGSGTLSTSCYYVKSLQAGVAKMAINLTFKDGQQMTVKASGKFTIVRPISAKAAPYQPDGMPTAQILSGALSLGISGITNDMSFSHTISTGSSAAGQIGYVQVIDSGNIETYPPISPINDALDDKYGEFSRGTPNVPANATTNVWFYDAPSVSVPTRTDAPLTEDVTFSTYLMFRPGGGIWVPLRLITWELHDGATFNAGTWTPYNSSDSGSTKITSDADSTAFPDWKTRYP